MIVVLVLPAMFMIFDKITSVKTSMIIRYEQEQKNETAASVAVGMSVMMGVTPAFAAGNSDSDVYKEETVYVNANARGRQIRVNGI